MKPTLKQQENLLKLAKGLAKLSDDYEHFDMVTFLRVPLKNVPEDKGKFHQPDPLPEYTKCLARDCGTAACAIGHGPSLGIKVEEKDYNSWWKYCERAFGIDTNSVDFDYLFHCKWG